MADAGRQSFTDKMSSSMKPDTQKSMTESMGDKMKGMGDSVASTLQPESQKSTTQQVGDSMSGNSNENQDSMMNKMKNAVGMGDN
uniref:Heat shock protein 9 n=1 Tax=Grifola frondosa TaxID=5627 RepID=S0BBY6_GRIFR|nr:heat shock protein 9 [Grifola frondosa]BAN58301.1 heat shock protein 9 [Grifola frondosa]